jgi:outer membrane protein
MKKLSLFLIILSLPSILGFAQSGFSEEKLTLNSAMQRALNQNHRILAMEHQVQETKENIGVARSQVYPQLSFLETLQSTNNPPQSFFFKLNERNLDFTNTDFNHPGTNTDYESKFQVTQPLYTGGRLSASINIAKQEAELSTTQKDRIKEEVAEQVVQTYFQVLIAKEYVRVAETAVTNAQSHYRITLAQFNEGRGIKSDMLRAQVYLTRMEETLVKSSTQLEIAKRNLALDIGENPSVPIDIIDAETFAQQTVDLRTSIQTGLNNRNEIRELEIQQAQLVNRKKAVNADRFPVINLVGSYQFNSENAPFGADADSWYGAVLVSLPIFDGGARYHRLKSTDATSRKLNETLEAAKKNISFQIEQAILQVQAAQKRVELTRDIVTQAEESLRIMEVRYQNGLCPLTDLLDAQTALQQAQGEAIQAKAEYNLDMISIDFYQGMLTKRWAK